MDTLMTGATQIFRHIQQNATLLQDAQFMEQGQGPPHLLFESPHFVGTRMEGL